MQFYKPNSKITGHALGLNFNSKEGALHAQFVKQTGWNSETKKGSFKEGKKFNLKFNATEIAAILNCIERSKSEKLFHQSEKGNTSIDIAPYIKDEVRNGITISVNPRSNGPEDKPEKYGFLFFESEARLLKEYLQFVLNHFFAAEYSAEKQRRQASTKEKVEESDPLA